MAGFHCTSMSSVILRLNKVRVLYLELLLNRSSAELGQMLGYHLATLRWMGSHPSVHSYQKALSAIGRGIPSLIILLKINRNDWTRRLKHV